jgi:steroid delta-isomerase-like uncharacterized protein
MSTETNKATVRRFLDQVLNEQRHDLAEEFLADNVEFHGPSGSFIGLSEVTTKWLAMMGTAFPDWRSSIIDVVAEGDKVVVRLNNKGTHQGEMEGIPATGKTVNLESIVMYHLTNGKIDDGRNAMDLLSFMQQLGVIPAPQAA